MTTADVTVEPNGKRTYNFPNGYSVVVKPQGDTGLFKVSIFHDDMLAYNSPGPNGVYRSVPADGVEELLADVAALPKA